MVVAFPILKTNRLLLRPFVESDAQALAALRSTEAVNRYIMRPKTLSPADALPYLQKTIEAVNKGELFYWAIGLHNKSALIGTCCVFRFSDDRRTAELGYELQPAYHGQGIITEAITAIIAFVFANTGLRKLKAFTHWQNQASIQTLLKQGFQLKPEEQDADLPDFLVYALSNLQQP